MGPHAQQEVRGVNTPPPGSPGGNTTSTGDQTGNWTPRTPPSKPGGHTYTHPAEVGGVGGIP